MQGVEEREAKLAVPTGFRLPPLDVAGVTVVDHGDTLLDAVYWDTDGLELACAAIGLRHRNGTWTFKGRSAREGDAVVREEVEIDGEAQRLPEAIRQRLGALVDVAQLHPVAHVRTIRHRLDIRSDAAGAELVHDRVTVLDGDREVTDFEEVEVEFPADSAALASRLVALVVAAGGVVDTTSKYVRALRALGHDPPEIEE